MRTYCLSLNTYYPEISILTNFKSYTMALKLFINRFI